MVVGSSKLTFPRGGIHPGGSKDRTKHKELIASEPPAVVEIPMVQHIGAPAKPVVDRKDEVKKGQLIGEAQGFISANVHAPLSGKVKKIANRIHNPTGKPVPAVIIENDGEEEWADGCNEKQSPEQMSPEELVDQVQQAGIVGMGGATFPSHVKLSPPEDKPIEDVILNGAECEPALTCDYRLMLEKTREILDAVRLIMRTVDAPRGHIGIESNKPDAIEAFNDAVAGERDIEVCPLEVKYPQGAEQQLIVAVTGREVPSGGGLPADVGCLVHNVATSLAIRDALRFRRPLIERPLTVTGDAIENAGNFIERIGTSVEDILQRQGIRESPRLLVMGGPMMGIAQSRFDIPLIKGNSGILLWSEAEIISQRPCIRCGRCVDHCPLGLVPSDLSIFCENMNWDAAKRSGMMECKECGCCAYVCPANRQIVHLVKLGKAELAKKKKKS